MSTNRCLRGSVSLVALSIVLLSTGLEEVRAEVVEPRDLREDGACCLAFGQCISTDDLTCLELDGEWLGPGTTCDACCQVNCTEAARIEAEECGTSTNNGCINGEGFFEIVTCGDLICGSAWAESIEGYFSDEDWYQITVESETRIFLWLQAEFSVEAGFASEVGIGRNPCDGFSGELSPSIVLESCESGVVSMCVPPGTYYAVVRPVVGQTFYCDRKYLASFYCGPCAPEAGACCLPDDTCVADTTEGECSELGGVWYANQRCEDINCAAGCAHSVVLYDSYGDGWNGAALNVLVNGELVLRGLTLDYDNPYGPRVYRFHAETGDAITTEFIPGEFDEECYYEIRDGVGDELCIDGDGVSIAPTGCEVIGNCHDVVGACCFTDSACSLLDETTCSSLEGEYLGDGTSCEPNPCLPTPDCNGNGVVDPVDISLGTSSDCNGNGVPDECDIADGTSPDCDGNGVPDSCELADGTHPDCDGNGVPDTCDIADASAADCNGNGVPDSCELADGTETDRNQNGVPDTCEPDTDGDGIIDELDACPDDPDKVDPGTCGCGVPDVDTDGDGVPDCDDGCPDDAAKTAPGACGCGTADIDSDGDGVLDCDDACPDTPSGTTVDNTGCPVEIDEGRETPDDQAGRETPDEQAASFMRGFVKLVDAQEESDDADVNHTVGVLEEALGALASDDSQEGRQNPDDLTEEELREAARLSSGVCPISSALLLTATIAGLCLARRRV